MYRFSKIFKRLLLSVIFGLLLLPLAQSNFHLFELKSLKGDISLPDSVVFKIEDWFSYKYQEQQEKYLNDMFGFRSTCVRINNQIAYSVFNYANANGVLIGKDGYLFEEGYINAYTGKDFLGVDSINKTLSRLTYLNDEFNKINKNLVVIFAPGKASYYPEYIPDTYLKTKSDLTNYKSFSDGAKKMKLSIIDFNDWFVKNKSISKYPLFPKHGIHWSSYSTAIVSDSIIKFIENIRHIDMPDFFYSIAVEEPHGMDCDIGDGMNLFFELKSINMGYPSVQVNNIEKNKSNILVISDSFYWGIYTENFTKCFNMQHFWYYNKQVFPETTTKELFTDHLDVKTEIMKHDVIVIMVTEANLKNIGWGFIEKAEYAFKNNSNHINNNISIEAINKWSRYIRSNKEWMKGIRLAAKNKKISEDSAITLDAIWQINYHNN